MGYLTYHKEKRGENTTVYSQHFVYRDEAMGKAKNMARDLAVPSQLERDDIHYGNVPPGNLSSVVESDRETQFRFQAATDDSILNAQPADPENVWDEVVVVESPTDPYGHITWKIGDNMDFVCFDAVRLDEDVNVFHSFLNSETGGMALNMRDPTAVTDNDAPHMAESLIDEAIQWCYDNRVQPNGSPDEFRQHVKGLIS